MQKLRIRASGLVVGVAILVSGCATVGDGDKTWKGAAIGTAGGAAVGAAVGATQGNAAKGAIWGAVAGAAVGTTTGVVLDAQEEKLRKAGIRAERDEQGRLLVNLSGDTLKFDTGKSTLKPSGMEQLSMIASIMRDYPENRIAIAGHTDSVGRDDYNLALSQARADSVKSYLLQQGVAPRCIVASQGFGERYPVADNATAAGRAQNRRVELAITVDEEEAQQNQQQRERYSSRKR
jgi:outer membrane protein OmpA-like peptidoglycan-associated protein